MARLVRPLWDERGDRRAALVHRAAVVSSVHVARRRSLCEQAQAHGQACL